MEVTGSEHSFRAAPVMRITVYNTVYFDVPLTYGNVQFPRCRDLAS